VDVGKIGKNTEGVNDFGFMMSDFGLHPFRSPTSEIVLVYSVANISEALSALLETVDAKGPLPSKIKTT
jgi:hypothetical protein